MSFENRKRKKIFHFGNVLTKLWASIYQLRTKWGKIKLWSLLAEHKISIFRLKFGKLLWRIWKIKSSACSLNLCPLNQLSYVTNSRVKAFHLKVKQGSLEIWPLWNWQKQSFAGVFQNRCSWKFHNIHKKKPVLEPLFNKVAGLKAYNFIKKKLQHRCFPVNITKFVRTTFL